MLRRPASVRRLLHSTDGNGCQPSGKRECAGSFYCSGAPGSERGCQHPADSRIAGPTRWGRDTLWKLGGELPRVPDAEPALRGLETLAVANRFDLAAARTALESMARTLGVEKTFRFCGALDLGIAGETESDKTNRLGPSIRLELPVFSQGQAVISTKLASHDHTTPASHGNRRRHGGVKVFHMTCDEVWHEFVPKTAANEALRAQCWGCNKQVHGPAIEAVEGDRLRICVTNNLPAPTSVHWHGIILPNGMDGVGGLTQKAIQPGETFKDEFTVWQHGTFMYHAHHDKMTQMVLGMLGMFIIHPREPKDPPMDRDFVYMLSEWRIDPGTSRPNPVEMTDFNILTLNGKANPGTAPIIIQKGDRVRIRIGNLSAMDQHPIHFHGHKWWVTETDGGVIPETARHPETTVLVPVGTTRTVEWIANNPGDWAFHCHMTHHVMNQMGHQTPNMIGVKQGSLDERARKFLPGYMTMGETGMAEMGDMGMKEPMVGAPGPHDYITMGGMYTNIKIREKIEDYNADPGWYERPPGTYTTLALADELRRDGITIAAKAEKPEESAARFACPMHPEVVSGKPGKCPKCGMVLKRSGASSMPAAHRH